MTQPAPVNVICPLGDPSSPRVWSGLPWNVVAKLSECGRLGTAEQIRISAFWHLLDYPIRRLLGETRRSRESTTFIHYLRVARTRHRVRQLPGSHILHIGTNEFPYRHPLGRTRNYLIIDAIWRDWIAGFGQQMLPPRSLEQAMDDRERACFMRADHIFTVSRHARERVISAYGIDTGKVTAIGTGIGAIRPLTGAKDCTRKKILFVAKGRFEEKGGHHLLASFRLARARDPELSLTLAGRDEYLERFGAEPGVNPIGYIQPGSDTLQRLFEEHNLFVMPSRHDPWGLVYLEALACRMPFVAMKRNAFDELSDGGKFGFGLDTESPEELANLLLTVLADPKELEVRGKAGQEFCLSRYTWEKVTNRILSVVDQYPVP